MAARREELDPRRVSFISALERTREATPCGPKSPALGLAAEDPALEAREDEREQRPHGEGDGR